MTLQLDRAKLQQLTLNIKQYAQQLGFADCRISDIDLALYTPRLRSWLQKNYHGDMQWIPDSESLRTNPKNLVSNIVRSVSVSYNYWHGNQGETQVLKDNSKAYIARYALGRDYHKLMRKKLARLGRYMEKTSQQKLQWRPFVDSAPILEKPLAEKAGLGWIGKNTLLLSQQGSYFFLGELLISLPLPVDKQLANQCGKCKACLTTCPTEAFVAPYQLDARKCIAYLTIEHKGSIDTSLRKKIGNRVFGCDDCQLICPWNRYAKLGADDDFKPRHQLDNSQLLDLFLWTEQQFLDRTAGSAIRRVGYKRWLRNISVGLGNSHNDLRIIEALQQRLRQFKSDTMLVEHFQWALQQQGVTDYGR